jgi:hypothetical protein
MCLHSLQISVNEIKEYGQLLGRHIKGAICDRSSQTCRTDLTGYEGWQQTVTQLHEPVLLLQQAIVL